MTYFKAGDINREDNYINESERDSVTPANDAGKVVKLEGDGRLSEDFLRNPVDIQEFTSDGTWTKPAFGTIAMVELWGGGASGGVYSDPDTQNRSRNGGGGGEYIKKLLKLSDLGSTESVTTGLGGASQTASGSDDQKDGNAGSDTTFGSHLTANGAPGGNNTGDSGKSISIDGIYGTSGKGGLYSGGSNGNSVYGGAGGGNVVWHTDSNVSVSGGGNSVFGGDGGNASFSGTGSTTAQDGNQPGGGGGAAFAGFDAGPATSGKGGDGKAKITVF